MQGASNPPLPPYQIFFTSKQVSLRHVFPFIDNNGFQNPEMVKPQDQGAMFPIHQQWVTIASPSKKLQQEFLRDYTLIIMHWSVRLQTFLPKILRLKSMFKHENLTIL